MSIDTQTVIAKLQRLVVVAQEPSRQCVICGSRFEALFDDDDDHEPRCPFCTDIAVGSLSHYEVAVLSSWQHSRIPHGSILVQPQIAALSNQLLATVCAATQNLNQQGYLAKEAIHDCHGHFEDWGYALTNQGRDALHHYGAIV